LHQVSTKLSCKILLWARNAFAQVKIAPPWQKWQYVPTQTSQHLVHLKRLRRIALGKTVHNKTGKCIKKHIVLGKGGNVLSCKEPLNMLVLSVK